MNTNMWKSKIFFRFCVLLMDELPTSATVPDTQPAPVSETHSDQELIAMVKYLQRRLDETDEKERELAECKRRIKILDDGATPRKERLARCRAIKKKLKIASSNPSDAKRPCANFSSCGIYLCGPGANTICRACSCEQHQ